MQIDQTYRRIQEEYDYDLGLVENEEDSKTSLQRHIFLQAKEQIENIEAVYFSGDIPFVYFTLLSDFDEQVVAELHKRVWNQNRVPLLYIITPGELRIYNTYARPADLGNNEKLDADDRLIRHIELATEALTAHDEFAKSQLGSDAFWRSDTGRKIKSKSDERVDQTLLNNLSLVRSTLHEPQLDRQGLPYKIIHALLGRSIFALYLEDRKVAEPSYFGQFYEGAQTYADVLQSASATYRLFDALYQRFNGDLFPIEAEEQSIVTETHLNLIRELFLGTDIASGQRSLWRLYDFSVIPIELISAVYEDFLHQEEGKKSAAETGAFYTPHPLVEFVLNQVLPWPSEGDSSYNIRILDPACGSGIFLVEAYRRLIARWKFFHKESGIPKNELKQLLTDHIFGVDLKLEAIRVAAFSLYLALLDHLEPKSIWRDFQFPRLFQGSETPNLFPEDALGDGNFNDQDYDLVIGNPPWERNPNQESIRTYCSQHNFPQQAAIPFMWKAREFAPAGKIALLAPSSILFNSELPDQNFRKRLFSENYVETVINSAALRQQRKSHGGGVFSSAQGPMAIFFYRVNTPPFPKDYILYYTPKPTPISNARPEVIIDASEIKFLPREKVIEWDFIWKVALWGTERDFAFIERLETRFSSSLHDYIEARDTWYVGRGFQKPGKGDNIDEEVGKLPVTPTEAVEPYQINQNSLKYLNTNSFDRVGVKEAYYAPHILLKRSPVQRRLCAAFVDYDCSFKDAIVGIAAEGAEIQLKALTAYINSSLAAYLVFMVSAMWGVERDRINKGELLALPDRPLRASQENLQQLANLADQISHLKREKKKSFSKDEKPLRKEIDNIIYRIFELRESDLMLIRDVLKYSMDHFYQGANSVACDPVDDDMLQSYAQTFCSTVNKVLQFGEQRASATVYTTGSSLRLVSFNFDSSAQEESVQMKTSSEALKVALRGLEEKVNQEHDDSIYFRRHIKIYDADTFHVIKPGEKRFWTNSAAINDADGLLAEGINSSAEYA